MLDQVNARLEEASRSHVHGGGLVEALKRPRSTTKSTLAIEMDDRSQGLFEAWHCRHDDGFAPSNGRILLRPSLTREDVEGHALLAMLKGALLGLTSGGAAAGIRVDPSRLSGAEFDRLRRCFLERFGRWMPAGGPRAVAFGAVSVLTHLAPVLPLSPRSRVSIAGFGGVGRRIADRLVCWDYPIVAASDSSVSVIGHEGLPLAKVLAAKDAGILGAVSGQRGVGRLSPEDAITADCDLLVLAGVPGMLDENNARRVRAAVVLEVTEGAVGHGADRLLGEAGVTVIPDILAGIGGIAERHVERTRDGAGAWSMERFDDWLDILAASAVRATLDLSLRMGAGLQSAAHSAAQFRLADVASAVHQVRRLRPAGVR